MKELRIQHEGRPYRVLFIFDPQRNAVLLIGGDKTGKDLRSKNMYQRQRRSTENIWRRQTKPERAIANRGPGEATGKRS